MRRLTLALALALVGTPPALASGETQHGDRFTAGGVLGVQELHQYRVAGERHQVLAVRLFVAGVADLDLVVLREAAGGCDALGCGSIVAHRMQLADAEMSINLSLPASATYVLEVEAWASGPGTSYVIGVSLDGAGPALAGPDRFIGVLGPEFYTHKSEDVVDQLVP